MSDKSKQHLSADVAQPFAEILNKGSAKHRKGTFKAPKVTPAMSKHEDISDLKPPAKPSPGSTTTMNMSNHELKKFPDQSLSTMMDRMNNAERQRNIDLDRQDKNLLLQFKQLESKFSGNSISPAQSDSGI